ncbi:hypothetical protein [Natrinema sp. SYSU A 869]|nr:hypothetical protein [Natrinema sp. SYSU A 869]
MQLRTGDLSRGFDDIVQQALVRPEIFNALEVDLLDRGRPIVVDDVNRNL